MHRLGPTWVPLEWQRSPAGGLPSLIIALLATPETNPKELCGTPAYAKIGRIPGVVVS